jgi:cysteinyl-tRNA synthetase
MYKLDFLIETFLKHAEEHKNNNERLLEQFKKMNPDEPIPDHMKEEFNLPMALATICNAIQELNKRLDG